MPKREGLVGFIDLGQHEWQELLEIGRAVRMVLRELFEPDRFDFSLQSNSVLPFHAEFIPRYKGKRTFQDVTFVDLRWGKHYWPHDYDYEASLKILTELADAIAQKL